MNKTFLLNLEPNKLNTIDSYCKSMGISRVKLFEELADQWLSNNTDEVKGILNYQVSYLDRYKDTIMYDECMKQTIKTKTKECIPLEEREALKVIADSLAEAGEGKLAVFLKDISHWQRHVNSESSKGKKPLSLQNYIDRKYTNPDLATY